MKFVIDTNIVFSAILNSNSRIGQIILKSGDIFKFYSTKYLQTEIYRHYNKIKKLTKLSDSELDDTIFTIFNKIHFISEEFISKEILKFADDLTKSIDFDDSVFVALTIQMDCKLWTGDKILINGLESKGFHNFISTQELFEIIYKKNY